MGTAISPPRGFPAANMNSKKRRTLVIDQL